MNKNIRTFTISGISGRYNETFPFIRIAGKWLIRCGFHYGDKIQVAIEHEKLVITKIPERSETIKDEDKTATHPLANKLR